MKRLVRKMNNRSFDSSDYVWINMEDVKYIDLWQETKNSYKSLAYHTLYGSYIDFATLTDASIAFESERFMPVDQSTIINRLLVKRLEDVYGGSHVHFVDGSFVFVRTKFK